MPASARTRPSAYHRAQSILVLTEAPRGSREEAVEYYRTDDRVGCVFIVELKVVSQ